MFLSNEKRFEFLERGERKINNNCICVHHEKERNITRKINLEELIVINYNFYLARSITPKRSNSISKPKDSNNKCNMQVG
jgi:hypothetical protein